MPFASLRRALGLVSSTSSNLQPRADEPKLVRELSPSSRDSLVARAATLYESGSLPEAELVEREAWRVSKLLDGEWHAETLKVKASLAITLREQAKFSEALEVGEDIVKAHSVLRGTDDPETRRAISSLMETQLQRDSSPPSSQPDTSPPSSP